MDNNKKKEYNREYNKNLYDIRKENGICTKCGKSPSVEGEVRCSSCKDKKRKQISKKFEELHKQKICTSCYKRKVYETWLTCKKCLDDRRKKRKELKEENIYIQCAKNSTAYRKSRCSDCLFKVRKKLHLKKIEIFNGYGGCVCACCGETHIEFLSIDHINGGGIKHRKSLGGSNQAIYTFILKNNFPPEFRVLCMNCNWSRGIHGYCPHEKQDN